MTGGGLVLSISALACARRGLNLPPVQRGSQVTCFLLGLALPELGLATDLSSLQLRDPPVGPRPGRVPCRRRVLNIKIRMRPADLHLIIATSSTSAAIKQQSGRHTTPWPRLVDNACLHLAVVQNKSLLKFQMNWLQQCNSNTNTIGWEWILWHSSPESPLLTTYSFPISQICKIHCHQKRQHLVSVRPASDVVTPRTCE